MRPRFDVDPRLVAGALGAALLVACAGGGATGPVAPPPAPVTVATVRTESVPRVLRAVGRVEPWSTVEIRSRVGGELVRVGIERGQVVRRGQLLFEIDARPFRAALDQAEARLAQDRAVADNAGAEVSRYAKLVDKDYVTREQYDAIVARAASTEATVQADDAAVRSARLDLEYCSIVSPIAGRAGDLLVHEGNLIKANADSPMVVLLQSRPVLVSFAVPEQHLAAIRARAAAGALEVRAVPSGAAGSASSGRLSFIDNAIDPATGTIVLKGTFDNEDDALWPGQFVDAQLELSVDENVATVPSAAVQRGQAGSYVFVVRDDGSVESRPVEVEREFDSRSIIASGLLPGETVVTEGQLRLAPGTHVAVKATP